MCFTLTIHAFVLGLLRYSLTRTVCGCLVSIPSFYADTSVEQTQPQFVHSRIGLIECRACSLSSCAFTFCVNFCRNDVTVRPWDGKAWPTDLTTLEYPPLIQGTHTCPHTNPVTAYTQLVGQCNSLKGTAAKDWTILAQRMRYYVSLSIERIRFVVPMFRSRQDDVTLVKCPPFSAQQVKQIWAGIRPNSQDLCIETCCARM